MKATVEGEGKRYLIFLPVQFAGSPLRVTNRNRDLQLNLRHQSVGELEPQLGAPAACRARDVVVHRAGMRSVTQEDADR